MQQINISEPVKIMIDVKYFGCCLERTRKHLNMTRAELAKIIGITNRELQYIECGKAVIHKSLLIKLLIPGVKKLNK